MSNRKKLIILGVVLVLLISAFVYFKFKKPFDPGVDVKTFTTAGQYEDYYRKLSEVYKKDTYGGKTPEETLQLFIDALKNGDTELAAKYYIPEKQKKEAESLQTSKDRGYLEKYVEILGSNRTLDKLPNEIYEATFFDKNGQQIHVERLIFNSSTKVWKIESL